LGRAKRGTEACKVLGGGGGCNLAGDKGEPGALATGGKEEKLLYSGR
jgi:hypothetical protein